MITLLIGKKGSGRKPRSSSSLQTKVQNSNGNVVVTQRACFTYDFPQARLVDSDAYGIGGLTHLWLWRLTASALQNWSMTGRFR